jgi:hypothetical protein
MAAGFKPNKSGIAKMMKDIQREMNKHPVTVPVNVDRPRSSDLRMYGGGQVVQPAGATHVYNGPVIQGGVHGGMQLAWNNSGTVNQHQANQQITAGYEELGNVVVDALKGLGALGLPDVERDDATAAGEEVLAEITQAEPDHGKIRRAIRVLTSILKPLSTAASSGAASGVQEGVHDWAHHTVEALGHAVSAL